ncbi:protein of unknown function [Methanoculleus bourgensis]|uniref:Uncharacterized protein n=1 Tax=Methanoculleus bourgensis TaxID=83986 RepID=A0A0X3BIS0_9EURY|nr:protein of unknown function [Methanoculleus bourgensis]
MRAADRREHEKVGEFRMGVPFLRQRCSGTAIDIHEFGHLRLSNINMVPEVFAQLNNSQLRNSVEDLLIEKREDVGIEDAFSFRRRRELLEGRVTKQQLDSILN